MPCQITIPLPLTGSLLVPPGHGRKGPCGVTPITSTPAPPPLPLQLGLQILGLAKKSTGGGQGLCFLQPYLVRGLVCRITKASWGSSNFPGQNLGSRVSAVTSYRIPRVRIQTCSLILNLHKITILENGFYNMTRVIGSCGGTIRNGKMSASTCTYNTSNACVNELHLR